MAKYRNDKVLKIIGERLKKQRKKLELKLEDIAEMTGFTYNTIRNMEMGNETGLSYFIEVCLALELHPKDVIDMDYKIKPRFELSAARKEKTRLTARVHIFYDKGFFKEYRSTGQVVDKIEQDYGIKTTTSAVSVILNRMVKSERLKVKGENRKNFYIVNKKPK